MFPRELIESFLKDYSKEDKVKITKDLWIVKQVTFDTAKPNTDSKIKPTYLATAGGPGSAKTTTLETFIKVNHLEHYVYADPDQVSLKNMLFTYRKSLTNYDFAEAKSTHEALETAYNKWRGASNYICHEMLQEAFGKDEGKEEKYSVAHGTTSTKPDLASLYERIKNAGYRVILLLCYSQDETRKKAIERRELEQAFVQTAPKDVISKGADFPKRFDVYFNYADEIHFYWNNELCHGKLPTPCATFTKNGNDSNLKILNQTEWDSFCAKYLLDIRQYDIKICESFKSLIPNNLLESPKKLLTLSANALPHVGLYNTRPEPIANLNVRPKDPSNDSSEFKTMPNN